MIAVRAAAVAFGSRASVGPSIIVWPLGLSSLETDGLIARKVKPTVTVEYSLTSTSRTLAEPLDAIRRWAERHIEDVLAARAVSESREGKLTLTDAIGYHAAFPFSAKEGPNMTSATRPVVSGSPLPRALVCAMAATLLTATPLAAQTIKVRTPRGVELDVAISVPANTAQRAPAVVIAAGQGYHMDLPIVAELAKRLAANGIIAIRFNWGYFTAVPQKAPAADLSAELEDLQAVLNFAKADRRVDANQMIIAGKSLGSFVAYRAFMSDPSARALVLLTPVCSEATDANGRSLPAPVPTGAQNYPLLAEITRPVVMVLGNADPLCAAPMLYDFVKGTKTNVVVVGGDHGWNVAGGSEAAVVARNARNVSAGVDVTAHWIDLILQR